jgi:NAD(P)H-flavin reductase
MLAAAEPARLAPDQRLVLSRRRETHDTVTLELDGAAEQPRPGQFNMLYAFGIGEVPISVSGSRQGRLAHTIRAVGMVTDELCRLRRGASVGVRGPFGTGWPLEDARGRDVLVVAGGVGLAPLRLALLELQQRWSDYGRIALLYGARTPADLLYLREVERWRSGGRLQVEVTVDSALAGWRGDVGVVPALLDRAAVEPRRAVAMICGPEVMMRFTVAALSRLGFPDDAIWISMERNMECAVGLCGHCQFGPHFVCTNGPVFRFDAVARLFGLKEV